MLKPGQDSLSPATHFSSQVNGSRGLKVSEEEHSDCEEMYLQEERELGRRPCFKRWQRM